VISLLVADATSICFPIAFTAFVLGIFDRSTLSPLGGEEPAAIHRRHEIKTDRDVTSITKHINFVLDPHHHDNNHITNKKRSAVHIAYNIYNPAGLRRKDRGR